MDYVIDKNAKNLWIRDNDDTMDLSPETDAGTVYLTNGRTLEQELGEGSMVSNVVTVNTSMSKVIDGTYDGAYESCIFKGQTKWIDNDTGEILDSFVANRNLSLIDVKMPVLKNVGKNLLDISALKNIRTDYDYTIGNYKCKKIKVEPNTTYTISAKASENVGTLFFNNIQSIASGTNYLDFRKKTAISKTYTTDNDGYLYVGTSLTDDTIIKLILDRDIQIKSGSTVTPYEPHKSNTLTTPKEIILRSLPNGVQDTYNPLTGEYVKRVGEKILSGNEDWRNFTNTFIQKVKTIDVYMANSEQKANSGLLCDKMQTSNTTYMRDEESISCSGGSGINIWVSISKDKLNPPNRDGFKQWLQSNPITIQYELAAPIIKKVDQKGYPFAYENGHVILESGYQGQSLLPIMDYSTVVNRTGQIKSIGEQSLRQDKQINKLEQMLVSNIIAMNYNNTLLKLNLTMNEVK